MPFASLGLAEPLVLAVQEKGYTQPTPIQLQAIPAILAGRDIMAAAQTGTGKTAGFTLPLLQRLLDGPKTKANHARALVLTPTRELAAQVQESVETYGTNLPLRSAVVFGGVSINPQMKSLRRGVDVLVATPGRLLDLHAQNAIRFDQIEFLVLDEADRMLDMGFIHDIKKVLALLPKNRQNLLFSATFCAEIRDLARSLLNDPLEVDVAPRNSTAEQVEQVVHPVDKGKKAALLSHLIRSGKWTQAIVFTRTKHGANKLVEYLHRDEISAAAIHSNKSQGARTRALADFKGGDISILVATDIAARGLDIPQLPQVVNFDLPNVPEDYVHRIGRTGRAGETGHAISLVDAEEAQQLWDIERLIKRQISRQVVADFEPTQPLPEGRPSQGKNPGQHSHNRRPQQARKPGQQGQRQQGERTQSQQAGRQNQGQPRNNRRSTQGNQDNFGNLESYGNRSQQRKPRSQGQRISHVDKALMGSPMSQRFDSHEEHRRAQALGNRIVPEHELQRTKRSQSPKQHPQQSFHSPSYGNGNGNGNGNSNGNGNGHKRQGQSRNQPRPQGAGARKPRNPQGSGHHQGRNWTPRPDA